MGTVISKRDGYAVRHRAREPDWSATVGMSRCA
ncbi:protein of unknown function (plasmid) [Cupriavidus taiwanensis]|nr:protein of unknown function [Cupriavidus taiwanensis]